MCAHPANSVHILLNRFFQSFLPDPHGWFSSSSVLHGYRRFIPHLPAPVWTTQRLLLRWWMRGRKAPVFSCCAAADGSLSDLCLLESGARARRGCFCCQQRWYSRHPRDYVSVRCALGGGGVLTHAAPLFHLDIWGADIEDLSWNAAELRAGTNWCHAGFNSFTSAVKLSFQTLSLELLESAAAEEKWKLHRDICENAVQKTKLSMTAIRPTPAPSLIIHSH